MGPHSCEQLLGAFAKLRKATISFVKSVCLSLCLSVYLSVCLSVSVRPSALVHSAPTGWIFKKYYT